MEIRCLDKTPDIDGGQQGRQHNHEDQPPLAFFQRRQQQIPLADKTGRARHAHQGQSADHNAKAGQWHALAQALHPCQAGAAHAECNTPQQHEDGALGHAMVEQVHDAAGQPGHRFHADADDHVADLGER